MAEFAPGFDANTLPKNATPLTERAVTNALVGTATGAAPGVSTVATRAQRVHPANPNQEAKATIAATTLINRNSTAGDVTALKNKFTKKKASFTFPVDKSGNGGSAFTRS